MHGNCTPDSRTVRQPAAENHTHSVQRPPRAPIAPTDSQDSPDIVPTLVEEQETTRHLGERRRRFSFDSLSRVAGFLL